jgi:hypothetical protein
VGFKTGVNSISIKSMLPLPRRIYLAAAGLFIAACNGWLRFGLTLSGWPVLSTLQVNPGVWYIALSGFLSGVVYTLCGITALLMEGKWKKVTLGLLVTGLALHWIDRIYFARSLSAQTSLPFSLAFATLLTMAAICLLFWDTIRSIISNGK